MLTEENTKISECDFSSFYFGTDDDQFTIIDQFNEWYHEALKGGYNQFSMPLTSAPLSNVKLIHPDFHTETEMINLSSYNYLGIATRKEVIESAKEALDTFGLGASGSPILSGTFQIGLDFAKQLAEFKKKEAAIIFPTGYSTNLGFISAILRPSDTILLDQFAHASIVDGAILSRAEIVYFKHNNSLDLEKKISKIKGRKLIVVEGVYSMDGDMCPLDSIVEVAKKYDSKILLDEAHSAFIFGENGRGIAELYGLEDQIDFHMGTFSKSLGGIGGYICGSKEVINYVNAYARSRFFSCNVPPTIFAGLSRGLKIAVEEPQLREKIQSNFKLMKEKLIQYGVENITSQSQIIPVMIGDETKTFTIAKKLLNEGIFVLPVVYPAVTKNKARLRVSISATLDHSQIDFAAHKIASVIHDLK